MPLAARILFGVFGLVVAVHAGASLTGHTAPPWWERPPMDERDLPWLRAKYPDAPTDADGWVCYPYTHVPRAGREAISVGVGAVGLAAVAFAAWPRRQQWSE